MIHQWFEAGKEGLPACIGNPEPSVGHFNKMVPEKKN